MTTRIVTGANGIKYITNEPFKPDYNTEAVLVEEMQRMAKRMEELETILERQTARIIDLQTHIENFDGEEHMTDYLAGGAEFLYPHAGDRRPPKDTKILLLTRGGVCIPGFWNDHWCLGWLELPKRNMEKEDANNIRTNKNT